MGEKKLAIPENVLKELMDNLKLQESAKVALDHHAERLSAFKDAFWKIIGDRMPETDGFLLRANLEEKTVTLLYEKSK